MALVHVEELSGAFEACHFGMPCVSPQFRYTVYTFTMIRKCCPSTFCRSILIQISHSAKNRVDQNPVPAFEWLRIYVNWLRRSARTLQNNNFNVVKLFRKGWRDQVLLYRLPRISQILLHSFHCITSSVCTATRRTQFNSIYLFQCYHQQKTCILMHRIGVTTDKICKNL
jgi:hypothetical protein